MEEKTGLSLEEQAQTEAPKAGRAYRVEMCFAWAIFLAAAALFVLTGSRNAFVPAIVGGAWAVTVRSKMKKAVAEPWQENVKRIIIFLLIAAFSQSFAPFYVSRSGAWRYPIIKSYVEFYHTCDIPDWFPDKIPDGAEDYRLDYLPSVMQGIGHFSARFKCSGEELDRIESIGKERALFIVPLADYVKDGADRIYAAGYEASPEYKADEDAMISYVVCDSEFWQGCEDGAVMYIISTDLDTIESHTDAIIVNRDSGMVQLVAQ